MTGVQRVTDIMVEITTAGNEQAVGIEQINQAVGEMDTVTQQKRHWLNMRLPQPGR